MYGFHTSGFRCEQEVRRHTSREKRQRARRGVPPFRALRRPEINALFEHRYGRENKLPNNNVGRLFARLLAHHLELADIRGAIRFWAPWMDEAAISDLEDEVRDDRQRWKADELGRRLNLTDAERTLLRNTTIGAVDVDRAEREKRRKARKRAKARERRAAKGATPRSKSLSATKPWLAEGVSRRTWERRRGGP
jgi:hypothetical protein